MKILISDISGPYESEEYLESEDTPTEAAPVEEEYRDAIDEALFAPIEIVYVERAARLLSAAAAEQPITVTDAELSSEDSSDIPARQKSRHAVKKPKLLRGKSGQNELAFIAADVHGGHDDTPSPTVERSKSSKAEEEIDSIALINLVHARPTIWDQRLDDYKNIHLSRLRWNEIADALGEN